VSGNNLLRLGYRTDDSLYGDIPKEAADSIREFIGSIANLKTQKKQIEVERALCKELPHFFDQRFNRLVARKGQTIFWDCLDYFATVRFRLVCGDYCNDDNMLYAITHEAVLALTRYNQYVFQEGETNVSR